MIYDAEKVILFLDILNSNEIELKLLTQKLAVLLALTVLSIVHGTFYLDIRYLIRHSSAHSFYLSDVTKLTEKSKTRLPIKYFNFTPSKNICLSPNLFVFYLYIQKQKARNMENQLLLGTSSSRKTACTQTISRRLVQFLSRRYWYFHFKRPVKKISFHI